LEGALKIIQFQTPLLWAGPLPPAQGDPSPVQPDLGHCHGWGITASLGNLGQCLTTLMVNFFKMRNDGKWRGQKARKGSKIRKNEVYKNNGKGS